MGLTPIIRISHHLGLTLYGVAENEKVRKTYNTGRKPKPQETYGI